MKFKMQIPKGNQSELSQQVKVEEGSSIYEISDEGWRGNLVKDEFKNVVGIQQHSYSTSLTQMSPKTVDLHILGRTIFPEL